MTVTPNYGHWVPEEQPEALLAVISSSERSLAYNL
jgi:pimeloyl-ACP methyl ester carboxylesterase